MTNSTDAIRIGRIALPYSRRGHGWVTPAGKIIRNQFKMQYLAERLNERRQLAHFVYGEVRRKVIFSWFIT